MSIATPNGRDPALQALNDLIHQRTGYFFDEQRLDRMKEKIEPLMLAHGLDSYLDYYYLLKYGEDSAQEWEKVASALAVNETYFWREYDQIRAAVKILVPALRRSHPDRPVRIWHAACATGEEPYSLAISLAEAGEFLRGPVEILASDFNPTALELAREGRYRARSVRSLPPELLERYFVPAEKDQYRLADSIRERVSFSPLNLLDSAAMANMQNLDLIFCRNVFIYFSSQAIRQVAENLHRALRTPGYLFVAAAESLLRITTLFDLEEIDHAYVYKKS